MLLSWYKTPDEENCAFKQQICLIISKKEWNRKLLKAQETATNLSFQQSVSFSLCEIPSLTQLPELKVYLSITMPPGIENLLLGFSRLTGNAPYFCFDLYRFIYHWNVSVYNVSFAAGREGQSVTQEILKLYHETVFKICDFVTQLQTLLRRRKYLCWREEL